MGRADEERVLIPRLKPYLGKEEILALFSSHANAVKQFEKIFADTFRVNDAISFPYGRSGLWAFLQAMGIKNKEIVQPAYTCSVVGHATVLSGNRPRFVDIDLSDYNMNLDQFADAINEYTGAVVPTHLFGYPMNLDRIEEIVRSAEKKFSHRIYIIQDCAHSFDAEWQGRSVIRAKDGALFGLNISKQITSIFGGMFTTDDEEIGEKVRTWRDEHFTERARLEKWWRAVYLMASSMAFSRAFYGLTYWLQYKSSFLKGLTDAYHLDEKIHFPPDYKTLLSGVEASVGLRQLEKYAFIKDRRREIAKTYFEKLQLPPDWVLPPDVPGATFSHFVIRVPEREKVMRAAARRGVQLGQLIEYSMPHHPAYKKYSKKEGFPNSLNCSRTTINLPIHPGLSNKEIRKILEVIHFIGLRK